MDWQTYKKLVDNPRRKPGELSQELAAFVRDVLGYPLSDDEITYLHLNLREGLKMAAEKGMDYPPNSLIDTTHRLMELYWEKNPRAYPEGVWDEPEPVSTVGVRPALRWNPAWFNYCGIMLAIFCVTVTLVWGFVLDEGDDRYPEQTNWDAQFAPICDQERGIGLYAYYTDGGFWNGSIPMDAEQFAKECPAHAPE